MALCPRVINQLLSSRLIILACFHQRKGSYLHLNWHLFLIWTFFFTVFIFFKICVCMREGEEVRERDVCVHAHGGQKKGKALWSCNFRWLWAALGVGTQTQVLGEEQQVLSSSSPVLDMNFNSHPMYYEKTTCGLRKVILTTKIFLIISLLNM